jgi:hypothetical protein
LPSFSLKLAQRACRLVMVTSLSKLTAHLSGKCALYTALKSADKYQLCQCI